MIQSITENTIKYYITSFSLKDEVVSKSLMLFMYNVCNIFFRKEITFPVILKTAYVTVREFCFKKIYFYNVKKTRTKNRKSQKFTL